VQILRRSSTRPVAKAAALADQTHLQAPFPARLRGIEIDGIDMVMLDADTAGCVRTWLDHAGQPASEVRTRSISACLDNLNQVLPLLTNAVEADYYRRLRDVADLICAHPQ
jgi:hypothetical protein